MIDRASKFADPEIVKMLQTRFVPVAIDQAYQRRQQDAEGRFYRKIAGQGPRNNFKATTQGIYIATPAGKLIAFNNNHGSEKIRRLMTEALEKLKPDELKRNAKPLETGKLDARYNPKPPEGGFVVRVRAKILDGYEESGSQWRKILQNAVSRDNLWVSKSEHEALVRGELPESLQRRIVRFHLIDNTRGEPSMWRDDEVRKLEMTLADGRLTGKVRLATASGDRGYEAEFLGNAEIRKNRVAKFDVVALGQFWGEGRYTRGAPKGKFPLAVSFTLADGTDAADHVPPQGSRGWVPGYIR